MYKEIRYNIIVVYVNQFLSNNLQGGRKMDILDMFLLFVAVIVCLAGLVMLLWECSDKRIERAKKEHEKLDDGTGLGF